jgi:hypothetical protein
MPDPKPRLTRKPKPSHPSAAPPAEHEVVHPLWLLKGVGITILAAIICGYLSFCLLFYQGQWQLVLHPGHTSSIPSTISGIPHELIRFAPDDSAVPQLTGWWIPAAPDAAHSSSTILFLPGGDGSMADCIPTLASLHHLGINLFAFDYRGYGQSAAVHPNQRNMTRDAESAWQYLTTSRGIPTAHIVVYGTGIGGSLATQLALSHPAAPALILDTPQGDLLEAAKRDPRTHLLPVSLLFHERFPLAQPLSRLKTPKLILSRSGYSFQSAAEPKVIAAPSSSSDPLYNQSLTRFLGRYLPPSPEKKAATIDPHLQELP